MIAICITTMERPELLNRTIMSVINNWQKDWFLLIGEQSKEDSIDYLKDGISYVKLPFNCGLSYARNELVKKAKELGCEYCVIGADSIEFAESMKNLNVLPILLKEYDLIGLNLSNRKYAWEAKMNLIPGSCFELEFIDKKQVPEFTSIGLHSIYPIVQVWNCDIVRNFFIARTDALLEVKWDNDLIMAEHEDFFWRFKLAGKKVGWTDYCSGNYIGEASKQDGEYAVIRRKNWNEGQKRLRAKYGIKGWVKYINLERAKDERN